MKIKNVELPKEQYKNKCPYEMKPIGITIHETDNNAPAKNEIAYMQRNTNEVSFHFAVDDVEAIQGLPLNRNSWNAGDGAKGFGNRKTISIEICKNYKVDNLEDYYKARANAEKLVGYLLEKYGWTDKDIYTHNDHSGKNCPRVILKENYLGEFKANAMKEKAKLSPQPVKPNPVAPKPVAPKPSSGIVKQTGNELKLNTDVYERSNPTTSDKAGLKLRKKGEVLEYNAYLIDGGYNWIRLTNNKWLPWRETDGEKWGVITEKKKAPKPTVKKYITLKGTVNLYDDNSKKYDTPSGKTRKVEVLKETGAWYLIRSTDFSPSDVWVKKSEVGGTASKPAPVTNVGKYANFSGYVWLFEVKNTDATYPAPSKNKKTSVRARSAKILEEGNGRVRVNVPSFSPSTIWLAKSQVSITARPVNQVN